MRFDHIAIPVADASAARHLFGEVLGLPLIEAHSGDDWDGAPWLMMIYGLEGDTQIALCALAKRRVPKKPATDLPHYALSVRDIATLQRWRKKLEDAGFDVRDENHGDRLSIYFEDRSDTTWEITAPPARNVPDPGAAEVVESWLAEHGR